mgnify:CR=1 FL=1
MIPGLRLRFVIQSGADRSWEAILSTAPEGYVVARRTDVDELVVFHEDISVTGVRLAREAGLHTVAAPAFAHPGETLAHLLARQTAEMLEGSISISGQEISIERFDVVMVQQILPQFLEHCSGAFARARAAAPRDAVLIEGYRRPYYLGPKTAARVQALVDRDGDDPYERLSSIVGAMQRLKEPTKFPAQHRIRTPDGEVALYTRWHPMEETLTPPFDYLLVIDDDGVAIRVAADRVADVVEGHGAMLDDQQWLLGQLDDEMADRVRRAARLAGKRMKLTLPS